ncbi:hypothetical protein PROPEN_03448 [Proteus penneri ATCC 35198]|nr:hypothetical protein PROPEN_03448 [Proteus penneri ATCC 35198]
MYLLFEIGVMVSRFYVGNGRRKTPEEEAEEAEAEAETEQQK